MLASTSAPCSAMPRTTSSAYGAPLGVGLEVAPEERDRLVGVDARRLDLEEHLERRFAPGSRRAPTRFRPFVRGAGPLPSARESETISMALTAASHPLLPAFVPARSIACSIVSVVSTPKATITPVSICTLASPFAASPAT